MSVVFLYEDKLPFNDEMKAFAYKLQIDPTACALSGGEEYDCFLLLTRPIMKRSGQPCY